MMNDIERPFVFMVCVWGEQFCNYLTEFCIPSLLSPKNIPALICKDNNKFVISCPPEDREKLEKKCSIIELQKYIEIIWHELNINDVESEKYRYMSLGHKFSTELAYSLKGYGVLITPDSIISDGTIQKLIEHAKNEIKVVFTAALRFGTEPLFNELSNLGHNVNLNDLANKNNMNSFCISPRELTSAAIKSMHTEALCYEWETAYFTKYPSACWWRVDDDTIIVHSLSWAAMMIDYSELESHDTDVFDSWTFDGDYIYKNFGDRSDFYIVQDSDEMISVSWASMDEGSWSTQPDWKLKLPLLGRLIKGLRFNYAFNSEFFDPVKHKMFALPVIWHGQEAKEFWKKREEKIRRLLLFYIPPEQLELDIKSGVLAKLRYRIIALYFPVLEYLNIIIYRLGLVFSAICGNHSAREKLIVKLKYKLFS